MTVSIYDIFKYISYFIFGIFAAVTDDLEWYGFIRAFITLGPAQINIDRQTEINNLAVYMVQIALNILVNINSAIIHLFGIPFRLEF